MTSPLLWIDLPGVVNMRDVGDKPTADGRITRRRTLVRTDNLQDLPPESVRWITDELGVTDVVDLRTNLERRGTGDGPLKAVPGIRFHELTLYREDDAETGIPDDNDDPDADPDLPWQDDADREQRERLAHDEHLARHYLGYLDKRPDNVVAALKAIAHAPGAVLVHCAAGKDRTGTIVALALTMVGVDRADIIADYDASNQRVDKIFARLAATPVYAADLANQTVADQMTPAATMEMLLRAVDDQFGGVAAWLAARGWSEQDTAALREKLTVANTPDRTENP